MTRYLLFVALVFFRWRVLGLLIAGLASQTTKPPHTRRDAVAPNAPGQTSRLCPLPPEPNPGVVTDEWILSQVVFDEDAEAPRCSRSRIGPPSRRGCKPQAPVDLAYPSLHGADIQSLFDADWGSQPSQPSRPDLPFGSQPMHEPIEDYSDELEELIWTSSRTQCPVSCQVPTVAQIHGLR